MAAATRPRRVTRVLGSGGNLSQQGGDDQAVKRQDDRQISPAEPVMRQHQRGRGDVLGGGTGGRHIHDDAKIQMRVVEAGDQPLRRRAQNRKYPDHFAGRGFAGA